MTIIAYIIGFFAVLVFILGVIAMFKPTAFDDKNKPNDPPGTRKMALGFIVFSFILSAISMAVMPDDKKIEAKPTAVAEQPQQAAATKQDQADDLKKFEEYHKSVTIPFNKMEDTYSTMRMQFTNLKNQNDFVAIYETAENLKARADDVMRATKDIDLNDDVANKHAKDYTENVSMLAYQYGKLAKIAQDVANGDSQLKPSEQLEIKKIMQNQQSAVISLVSSMMATYETLGVKSDQIDTKNGGVKK